MHLSCPVDTIYAWPGPAFSKCRSNSLRNMDMLRRTVDAFQPDVLHSFSRLLYMLPLMRRDLPKIMTYQREPTPRTVHLGAMLASGSLTFTGCSEYICSRGRRAGGDWRAVHNFVDVEFFQFQAETADDAPLSIFKVVWSVSRVLIRLSPLPGARDDG